MNITFRFKDSGILRTYKAVKQVYKEGARDSWIIVYEQYLEAKGKNTEQLYNVEFIGVEE